MVVYKQDEKELRSAISALKLQMFKGASNYCKKCKRKGDFGSVIKYQCESGKWYILCGWCGGISRC